MSLDRIVRLATAPKYKLSAQENGVQLAVDLSLQKQKLAKILQAVQQALDGFAFGPQSAPDLLAQVSEIQRGLRQGSSGSLESLVQDSKDLIFSAAQDFIQKMNTPRLAYDAPVIDLRRGAGTIFVRKPELFPAKIWNMRLKENGWIR